MSASGLSGKLTLDKGYSSGRAKFQTINISSVYSGKSLIAPKSSNITKNGLQSLGKTTAVARRMPPPANLPSLKSEGAGQDPNVTIVPSGVSGWGTNQNAVSSDRVESGSASSASLKASSQSQSFGTGLSASGAQSSSSTHSTVAAGGGRAGGVGGDSAKQTWSSRIGNIGPAAEQGFVVAAQEFPKLAGNQPQQEMKGPSLRPQKAGSWKCGGSSVLKQDEANVGRDSSLERSPPTESGMPGYRTSPGYMHRSSGVPSFTHPLFSSRHPANYSHVYPFMPFPSLGTYPSPSAYSRAPPYDGRGSGSYRPKDTAETARSGRISTTEPRQHYETNRNESSPHELDYHGDDRDRMWYSDPVYRDDAHWSDTEQEKIQATLAMRKKENESEMQHWSDIDDRYDSKRKLYVRYEDYKYDSRPGYSGHAPMSMPLPLESSSQLLPSQMRSTGQYVNYPGFDDRHILHYPPPPPMHMSRPSDLRYIEMEEEEEMFRQQQQLHVRNAAIERSWQRRRLAQQASLSSSGTTELGPPVGITGERYYSSAAVADVASDGDGYESEIDRPNSVDGYTKRRPDVGAGRMQPPINAYQQHQPYGSGERVSPSLVGMMNAHPYAVDYKRGSGGDETYEKPLPTGGRNVAMANANDRRRVAYSGDYCSSKVSGADMNLASHETDSAHRAEIERTGSASRDSLSSEKSEKCVKDKENNVAPAGHSRKWERESSGNIDVCRSDEEEDQKFEVLGNVNKVVMKRTVGMAEKSKILSPKDLSDLTSNRHDHKEPAPLLVVERSGQEMKKNVWEQRKEQMSRTVEKEKEKNAPVLDSHAVDSHSKGKYGGDASERGGNGEKGKKERSGQRNRGRREFVSSRRMFGKKMSATAGGGGGNRRDNRDNTFVDEIRDSRYNQRNDGGSNQIQPASFEIVGNKGTASGTERNERRHHRDEYYDDYFRISSYDRRGDYRNKQGGRDYGAGGTKAYPRSSRYYRGKGRNAEPGSIVAAEYAESELGVVANDEVQENCRGAEEAAPKSKRLGPAAGENPADASATGSKGSTLQYGGQRKAKTEGEAYRGGRRVRNSGASGTRRGVPPRFQEINRGRRSEVRYSGRNAGNQGQIVGSPTGQKGNQSEGIDEWATASESSDIAERRKGLAENKYEKKKAVGPKSFSSQRRSRRRSSGLSFAAQGNDAHASTITEAVPKNVQVASHQMSMKLDKSKTEHRSSNSTKVDQKKTKKDERPAHKSDALATVDISNIAGVVVIDDQPDVTNTDSQEGFQEVMSKKEKRLRRDANSASDKEKLVTTKVSTKKSRASVNRNSAKYSEKKTGMKVSSSEEGSYGTASAVVKPEIVSNSSWESSAAVKQSETSATAKSASFENSRSNASKPATAPSEEVPQMPSKTGVEIWGTPDPVPFTGPVNESGLHATEALNAVSEPAKVKAVEFVTNDATKDDTSKMKLDFTFDANLAPRSKEKTINQVESNDVNDSKKYAVPVADDLSEKIASVKRVWENMDLNCLSNSAASVNAVSGATSVNQPESLTTSVNGVKFSISAPLNNSTSSKADGPNVAKVRPQQILLEPFSQPLNSVMEDQLLSQVCHTSFLNQAATVLYNTSNPGSYAQFPQNPQQFSELTVGPSLNNAIPLPRPLVGASAFSQQQSRILMSHNALPLDSPFSSQYGLTMNGARSNGYAACLNNSDQNSLLIATSDYLQTYRGGQNVLTTQASKLALNQHSSSISGSSASLYLLQDPVCSLFNQPPPIGLVGTQPTNPGAAALIGRPPATGNAFAPPPSPNSGAATILNYFSQQQPVPPHMFQQVGGTAAAAAAAAAAFGTNGVQPAHAKASCGASGGFGNFNHQAAAIGAFPWSSANVNAPKCVSSKGFNPTIGPPVQPKLSPLSFVTSSIPANTGYVNMASSSGKTFSTSDNSPALGLLKRNPSKQQSHNSANKGKREGDLLQQIDNFINATNTANSSDHEEPDETKDAATIVCASSEG